MLERDPLRARITGNEPRLYHLNDNIKPGYNGIASLIDERQGKNVFNPAGMNYECSSTTPPAGERRDLWNAPRVAPMKIEQIDEHSVRLTQSASETSGLNAEIVFALGDSYVDQTIATWPDHDVESSRTFWASYMNQVQCTSLFMRARRSNDDSAGWLEATNPIHGGGVYYRPFDPTGKAWHEHLADNPVLRQDRGTSDVAIAAARGAGFAPYEIEDFGGFFYGLVDDYVLIYIFREDTYSVWCSASGGSAVRSPAWDYAIDSGPQSAGERLEFHARLVYKPFAGAEDVMSEVERFRAGGGE